MEDIHPELVKTVAGNKMVGMICLAIACILVLMAISISVIFAFNFFPKPLTDVEKDAITHFSNSGLIIAIILGIGAWFMLVKSINWFKQSTKLLNEAEPVRMMAVIKTDNQKNIKDVTVELIDGEKKINLCMYYPTWDIEGLNECEVEVYKNDDHGPIIVKTSHGILWPYPPIVKQ